MASGWASQESFPDRKVVGLVVTHVLYPEKFKAATVLPEDIIAFREDDGALSDLCPSLQVPKLTELSEVTDQVNKAKLHK